MTGPRQTQGDLDPWVGGSEVECPYKLFDLRPEYTSCHRCCPDVTTVGGDYGTSLMSQRMDNVSYSTNRESDYAERRSIIRARTAGIGSVDNDRRVEGNGGVADCPVNHISGSLRSIDNGSAVSPPTAAHLNNDSCTSAATLPALHRTNSLKDHQHKSLYHSPSAASIAASHHYGTYGSHALAHATPARTLNRDSTASRVTWRDAPITN
jgi:hypothetical protein